MNNEVNSRQNAGMKAGFISAVIVLGIMIAGMLLYLAAAFVSDHSKVAAAQPVSPAKMVCERVTGPDADFTVSRCRDTELHATCYTRHTGTGTTMDCLPDQWLYTDQAEPN